ncbi:hypothetical protein [Mesoterricola sediminis]|uniref:Uncharacterized protein n=1 Tax=Mesoterricola sediminis TaxID=2927980 RepID=A0AA48GXI8_9BACT|nr:hypothetical protein [Mesoterricola sediminis]BDU75872.1 hypothetical protein METESE_08300 [Mesoterricola sediminis]
MVADASWDQPLPPPRKKGLSIFGKVAIGCGGAFLCFLLAIGALVWVVVSKATGVLDRGWTEVRARVESLRTDDGARRLYRENPGLAQAYPTEADFLKACAEWRPRLGHIPEKRPELLDLAKGKGPGGVSLRSREVDGRQLLTIRMRMDTGARLVVDLEDDKLTDIQVE